MRVITCTIISAVVAFSVGYFLASQKTINAPPPMVQSFIWPPLELEPFKLIQTTNQIFDETNFLGHWTLIFFGYTHCPDICPTTMATLAAVNKQLSNGYSFQNKPQILFVSVDPERDKLTVLKRYKNAFDPNFIAATANQEQLHRLVRQFGSKTVKISSDKKNQYWYDHPATVSLVSPDRSLMGMFLPPFNPTDISSQIETIAAWYENLNQL